MKKITLIIINLLCFFIIQAQQESINYTEPKIYEIGVSYHGRKYSEGKKIRYYDVFSVVYWIISTKIKKFFL